MAKTRFKLSFRCITMLGAGGSQRGLIIAVSPIPGVPGWMQAVIAAEDGTMIQKAIAKSEFDMAARNEITLMEADDAKAAPIIYTPSAA